MEAVDYHSHDERPIILRLHPDDAEELDRILEYRLTELFSEGSRWSAMMTERFESLIVKTERILADLRKAAK